ncbi:MAG TPA: aldo/keto reductase [Bacteroidales bacterium]|nr:aldo/keto reductase [Bacteroidales bacterium]HRZ78063.1 aldo/keto reductase [Bacteroidales bacterium]
MSERLVLGTVQFGLDYGISNEAGKPSESEVGAILDQAFFQGIRCLDTADAYGTAVEVLGNYNRLHPGRFQINSKFKGHPGQLKDHLLRSLGLLGIPAFHVYFYHSFADFMAWPELRDELAQLKQDGLIRFIGVSVYGNEEFRAVLDAGWVDVVQIPFNMLDNRTQRGECLARAHEQRVSVQARSVYLQGLFFLPLDKIPARLLPLRPWLEEIHRLARAYDVPIQQLALHYVLQQEDIAEVVIGVDSRQQLEDHRLSPGKSLPKDLIEKVNQIRVTDTELLYPKNW